MVEHTAKCLRLNLQNTCGGSAEPRTSSLAKATKERRKTRPDTKKPGPPGPKIIDLIKKHCVDAASAAVKRNQSVSLIEKGVSMLEIRGENNKVDVE